MLVSAAKRRRETNETNPCTHDPINHVPVSPSVNPRAALPPSLAACP